MEKNENKTTTDRSKICPAMADGLKRMTFIWGEMMSAFSEPGKQPIIPQGTRDMFSNHSQGEPSIRRKLGASVFRPAELSPSHLSQLCPSLQTTTSFRWRTALTWSRCPSNLPPQRRLLSSHCTAGGGKLLKFKYDHSAPSLVNPPRLPTAPSIYPELRLSIIFPVASPILSSDSHIPSHSTT